MVREKRSKAGPWRCLRCDRACGVAAGQVMQAIFRAGRLLACNFKPGAMCRGCFVVCQPALLWTSLFTLAIGLVEDFLLASSTRTFLENMIFYLYFMRRQQFLLLRDVFRQSAPHVKVCHEGLRASFLAWHRASQSVMRFIIF